MRTLILVVPVLFLTSCAKQDTSATSATPAADLPHATVVMRDGSRAFGTVAASTPSEITLNLDGGGTKTIAMKDVRRVDYGEAPAPKTAASGSSSSSAPAAAAPPEPTHEDHYHPAAAAVVSKTRALGVGTEVPVRTEETIDSGRASE